MGNYEVVSNIITGVARFFADTAWPLFIIHNLFVSGTGCQSMVDKYLTWLSTLRSSNPASGWCMMDFL